MIFLRPTPQQERWMTVDSRLGVGRGAPWIAERVCGWVAVKSITRCALFVLGAVAAGLTAAVFSFTHIPGHLFVAGVILVAAAEWLVNQRRIFGAGIEEALEIAGLLMIAFQVLDQSSDLLGVRTSLLIAMMLAVAGFRFLNPFFVTLSAVAFSCTIDFAGMHRSGASAAAMASVFCFAVASIALSVGKIKFHRPAYDQMLNWLVVTMPLTGYLWLEERYWDAAFPAHLPIVMLVPFGAAALIVGIRRRTHAPLIAFMICVGCIGYELRNMTGLSLKVRLIFWGSSVFLLTLGLGRYLRTPRRGLCSSKAEQNESWDLLQLAGAGGLASQSAHHPDAQFKGGGGAGGGGGASGTY